MSHKISLSIILPVYNLEESIRQTIEESVAFLAREKGLAAHEMIVVNDGSRDQTGAILKELMAQDKHIRLVAHERNLGYGRAMTSGIRAARFPWVLLMDADGQFKVEAVQKAMSLTEQFDLIAGYRQERRDPLFRIILGNLYTRFVCALFGLTSKDINCGFKLIKKESIDLESIRCHAGAFYTNIFIQAKAKGLRVKEFPVEHFARATGRQTGASPRVIVEAVADVWRIRMSLKPEKKDRTGNK